MKRVLCPFMYLSIPLSSNPEVQVILDVTARKRDADFEFIINNPSDFAGGKSAWDRIRLSWPRLPM